MQVLTAPIALAVDAVSFIVSALFLTRVKADEPPVEPDPAGIRERFAAGLRFATRDPIIRPALLAAATINFFNFAFSGAVRVVRDALPRRVRPARWVWHWAWARSGGSSAR